MSGSPWRWVVRKGCIEVGCEDGVQRGRLSNGNPKGLRGVDHGHGMQHIHLCKTPQPCRPAAAAAPPHHHHPAPTAYLHAKPRLATRRQLDNIERVAVYARPSSKLVVPPKL